MLNEILRIKTVLYFVLLSMNSPSQVVSMRRSLYIITTINIPAHNTVDHHQGFARRRWNRVQDTFFFCALSFDISQPDIRSAYHNWSSLIVCFRVVDVSLVRDAFRSNEYSEVTIVKSSIKCASLFFPFVVGFTFGWGVTLLPRWISVERNRSIS